MGTTAEEASAAASKVKLNSLFNSAENSGGVVQVLSLDENIPSFIIDIETRTGEGNARRSPLTIKL